MSDLWINRIEIDMECWTYHYPTGAVIYYSDGSTESDFCDTVPEYKRFLDEHRDVIKRVRPRVIVKMDMSDIDTSNVVDAAREIYEYIDDMVSGRKGLNTK